MFQTALGPAEVLTGVRIGEHAGFRFAYEKFPHPASGYAVVGVAVALKAQGDRVEEVRIAATGVAYRPFRLTPIEEALRQGGMGALEAALAAYTPEEPLAEDRFASAEYRLHLLKLLTKRALEKAA